MRILLAAIFLVSLPSFSFAEPLPQIAVGSAGSYLVKSDGTLWAWGDYLTGKTYGTPAAEKANTHTMPVRVDALSAIVAISAGGGHTIVLKKDGTVWVWGFNGWGQLGNGAIAGERFPTPGLVSSLSDIKAIAAGDDHSLALKNDGTVWAWGNNWHGQVGDGTDTDKRPSGSQVNGLSNVTAIAAGMAHSLALTKDGSVWAWGYNDDGELGDGTRKDHLTPTQIPGLSEVKAIAAGFHHSLALKEDGTVWEWGGQEKARRSTKPRILQGLSRIVAISAGGWYSLALKQDGTVWAWGVIANGEEDDHTMNEVINRPVQIKGLTDVIGIAAGMWHSLAIKKDGSVWAWGRNYYGALGDGTETSRRLPVRASIHD